MPSAERKRKKKTAPLCIGKAARKRRRPGLGNERARPHARTMSTPLENSKTDDETSTKSAGKRR